MIKFAINQENLKMLLLTEYALDTALASTSMLKFEITDSTLAVTTTNSHLSVKTELITEEISGTGEFLVDARVIRLINTLSGVVHFEYKPEKGFLSVECGSFKGTLQTLDAETFPSIDKQFQDSEELKLFAIDSEQFISAVKSVMWSVSNKGVGVIDGINISGGDDKLTFRSTDRISLSEVKLPLIGVKTFEATVPLKSLKTIIGVLKSEDGVTFYGNDKFFATSGKNYKISSRLLAGEYPNFAAITTKKLSGFTLNINRRQLALALSRADVLSDDGKIIVTLSSKEDFITLTLGDEDLFKETVPFEGKVVNDFTTSFSIKKLEKALQQPSQESVILNFSNALSPLFIFENDSAFILAPTRVK